MQLYELPDKFNNLRSRVGLGPGLIALFARENDCVRLAGVELVGNLPVVETSVLQIEK